MYKYRHQPNSNGENKRRLVLIGNYWTEVLDNNPLFMQSLIDHEVPYSKFRVCKTNPYSERSLRINLMYITGQAIMCWKRKKSEMGYYGIQCVLFRNKSSIIASKLIVDGQKLARERFIEENYFVYLDPAENNYQILRNGFLKAGWKRIGISKKNFDIFEIIQKD